MKLLLFFLTLSVSLFAAYTPKTLADVTVSSAGTRVQVSSSAILAASVCFQGKASNSGKIYVGGSSVAAAAGIEIAAGQAICFEPNPGLDVVDLRDFYLDASASSQVAKILYLQYK